MGDDLGSRMKEQYEHRTRFMLPRRTYTIIRVDGKAFHTFTRNCKKPFDEQLMQSMCNAAIWTLRWGRVAFDPADGRFYKFVGTNYVEVEL